MLYTARLQWLLRRPWLCEVTLLGMVPSHKLAQSLGRIFRLAREDRLRGGGGGGGGGAAW